MPARHLGFSNGSAASIQGIIISLDFLLPFAARPATVLRHARRGYASAHATAAAVEVGDEANAQAGPSRLASARESHSDLPPSAGCGAEGVPPEKRRSRQTGDKPRSSPDAPSTQPPQADNLHASTVADVPHKPPDPPGTSGRSLLEQPTTPLRRDGTDYRPQADPSQPYSADNTLSQAFPSEPPRSSHRSFVHKYLDRDSPPSPTLLRDNLRARPSLINSQALTALANLADRTGHEAIAANVRLARRKVDGQYWVRPDQVQTRPRATDDSDAPWRWKGLKPHRWARDNWPPERFAQPLNMAETMRDLHFRVLCATSRRPASTPAQAVETVLDMCKAEKRGPRGRLEALSGVLHLYIIYAPHLPGGRSGVEVMEEILTLCPGLRPGKQALHLLVQQLIWPRLLQYPPIEPLEAASESDGLDGGPPGQVAADAVDRPPRSRPRTPNDDPQAITTLLHLLTTLHRMYGLTPGTETFRHLLTFAALTDNRMLGDLAVRGYALASREPSPRTPGEGDLAKWSHSGTRRKKWRDLVRTLKHKGWLSGAQAESAMRAASPPGSERSGRIGAVEGERGMGRLGVGVEDREGATPSRERNRREGREGAKAAQGVQTGSPFASAS